jgi:hypothetical protein
MARVKKKSYAIGNVHKFEGKKFWDIKNYDIRKLLLCHATIECTRIHEHDVNILLIFMFAMHVHSHVEAR